MTEPATAGAVKREIQTFWSALYDSLYEEMDRRLTRDDLVRALGELEDMFRRRSHMAAVEMPLAELAGKRVLEIGSGAGGHSALFACHGARVTAVDITFARARSTAVKFALLGDFAVDCGALQADCENLPFADNSFDIVYSNGVLHHTADTEQAIAEVWRVLVPEGRAVIMLYCKDSWQYWVNLWLGYGLLKGMMFGDPDWVGKATEWGGRKRQTAINPITRCYTRAGIRRLFRRFEDLRQRKGEFDFALTPKIGKLWRRWRIRRHGTHPGGILVYGAPWPIVTSFEQWLGRSLGFAWFISARKPAAQVSAPSGRASSAEIASSNPAP